MRLDRTGFARTTLAILTTAVALNLAGCSAATSTKVSPDEVGGAELNLSLPDNTTISTVSYTVTRSGGFSRNDNIPVGNSQMLTFQVGNLPANTGYSIVLGATTSDKQTCSAGPVSFDIMAHNTALIMMTLRCGGGVAAATSGNVRVDVDVVKGATCAQVDGLTALPRSVNVGSSISLKGFATTSDATYAWTVSPATGGTFSSATDQAPSFTCTTAGTQTVTLTVTSGGSCAPDSDTIPLICTGAGAAGSGAAGTGATAGTGAAGTGAAGTGAAGVGTAGTTAGTGTAGVGTAGTTAGTGTAGVGTAGTGTAGVGTAGTGTAGVGTAGTGTAGTTAGTGTAGTTAGTGTAGTGTAGTGTAGTGTAGTGTAGTGTAGTGAGGTGGGVVSAACTACRETNCRDFEMMGIDVVGGCFEAINTSLGAVAPDPAFLQDCIDFTTCAYTNKCAYGAQGPADCYCGAGADTTSCIMNGPAANAKCVAEVQRATRSTSSTEISTRLTSLVYPAGWAYFLLSCDVESCSSTCVPQ